VEISITALSCLFGVVCGANWIFFKKRGEIFGISGRVYRCSPRGIGALIYRVNKGRNEFRSHQIIRAILP
jgi:hypothetical protein